MFDFLKKITSEPSKKPELQSSIPVVKPTNPERKSEEPRQTLNNGLSKQLFSDVKISQPQISSLNNPSSQSNEKKFKIFEDKTTKKEENAECFANYMNASMNFGRLKSEKPEENFKETKIKESSNRDIITTQLNKTIVNNTKTALEENSRNNNIRKKIFDEQPQKKMGEMEEDVLRKASSGGDLIAEKSLNILQCNQNVIMNHEDNMNMKDVLKEIDAHYFNENTEDNLIHKELLRLPKNAKIDEVAARVEVLDRYNNMIAAKLSKNALKHYEKFGF